MASRGLTDEQLDELEASTLTEAEMAKMGDPQEWLTVRGPPKEPTLLQAMNPIMSGEEMLATRDAAKGFTGSLGAMVGMESPLLDKLGEKVIDPLVGNVNALTAGMLAPISKPLFGPLTHVESKLSGPMPPLPASPNVAATALRDIGSESAAHPVSTAAMLFGLKELGSPGKPILERLRSNPLELAKQSKDLQMQALGKGIERVEKRGPEVNAAANPQGIDLAIIEGDLKRAEPLVQKQNELPKDMDAYREALHDASGKMLRSVNKKLETTTNKGIEILGDDMALEQVKQALPEGSYERMPTNKQQELNSQIKELMKFRGREYGEKGINALNNMLLNPNSRFGVLPQEVRTRLAQHLNDLVNSGEEVIKGDEILVQGLKELNQGTGLGISDANILELGKLSDRYAGKKFTPWELDDRKRQINRELSDFYKKKKSTQTTQSEDFYIGSLEKEGQAISRMLNEVISKFPDEFREMKLDLGALMNLQEVARHAGIEESKTAYPDYVDRALDRPNWLATTLSLFGLKGNKDLMPSERIQKSFKKLKQSQGLAPAMSLPKKPLLGATGPIASQDEIQKELRLRRAESQAE